MSFIGRDATGRGWVSFIEYICSLYRTGKLPGSKLESSDEADITFGRKKNRLITKELNKRFKTFIK